MKLIQYAISFTVLLSWAPVQGNDICRTTLLRSSEPHIAGPRTAADYLTPQSPIRRLTPVPPAIASLKKNELERLLSDTKFAVQIYSKIEGSPSSDAGVHAYNPDDLAWVRRHAAILLSRMNTPNLVPGIALSDAQFRYQAALLEGKIETHKVLYRVDARSPREIAAAGGFKPNPNKKPYTLWENVYPFADGGSNFVSTSLQPGELGVVELLPSVRSIDEPASTELDRNDQLTAALNLVVNTVRGEPSDVHPLEEQALQRILKRIEEEFSSRPDDDIMRVEVSLHRGYEYILTDVEGMRVPEPYGKRDEYEVVTTGVSVQKITQVRRISGIYVHIMYDGPSWGRFPLISEVISTNWRPLRNL